MRTQSSRETQPTGRGEAPSDRAASGLVVGHDKHPASDAALDVALDLAARLRVHLHVVHSVTLDDYGIDPDIEQFETDCKRNLATERENIASVLTGAGVQWTYHETRGDPASRLEQVADAVHASMIVVGAHHRHLLGHLLDGGAIPERLIHHQRRPVLVVPNTPVTDRPA